MSESVRERLARQGRLQQVPVDDAAGERLLSDAQLHLNSAEASLEMGDLAGSYQLLYDAARKSVTAFLARSGLRIHGPGAHAHAIELAAELVTDPATAVALRPLDRLRRTRNEAEYDGRWFDKEEVRDDLVRARAIVATFADLVDPASLAQDADEPLPTGG